MLHRRRDSSCARLSPRGLSETATPALDSMHFQRSYSILAKPAPVFDLLTRDLHLREWFAEEVEAGTDPGQAFRFWGRHTPWVPTPQDAKQTLTDHTFPSALAFDWPWNQTTTHVAIEVSAEGEGSVVRVSHDLEGTWPAAGEAQKRIVAAFWELSLINLQHYFFEGEPSWRPDFSAPASQQEIEIQADARAAYRALTTAAGLDSWIGDAAEVLLEEGGIYTYGWQSDGGEPLGPSRVVAFRDGVRLVHDWRWPGAEPGEVHWEIEDLDDLVVVKRRLALPEGSEAHDPSELLLASHALVALKARLEAEAEASVAVDH